MNEDAAKRKWEAPWKRFRRARVEEVSSALLAENGSLYLSLEIRRQYRDHAAETLLSLACWGNGSLHWNATPGREIVDSYAGYKLCSITLTAGTKAL